MKNNFIYWGLVPIVILLISYSCKKETIEIDLSETTENNIPDESQTSLSELGTRLFDFPGAGRRNAVSFSTGTKIYMGFGYGDSGSAKDFWQWDYNKAYTDSYLTTKDLWTKLPDFPGSNSGTPLGFAVNGKGYILPGVFWNSENLENELWEFDPETSLWIRKANPPATLARYWATGFTIGTKIYIGTGETYFEDQQKFYNDLWEWDQTTDTWTQKAYLPGPGRSHAIGFSIGNNGYIGLGEREEGMGEGTPYNDLWEYDQATDKWTQKAKFKGAQISGAVAFSAGNKGYVIAGSYPLSETTGTLSDYIFEWDNTTDEWTKIGIFAGGHRFGAVVGTIGKWGYLSTGMNLSKDGESYPWLNDFWLFDLTSE